MTHNLHEIFVHPGQNSYSVRAQVQPQAKHVSVRRVPHRKMWKKSNPKYNYLCRSTGATQPIDIKAIYFSCTHRVKHTSRMTMLFGKCYPPHLPIILIIFTSISIDNSKLIPTIAVNVCWPSTQCTSAWRLLDEIKQLQRRKIHAWLIFARHLQFHVDGGILEITESKNFIIMLGNILGLERR